MPSPMKRASGGEGISNSFSGCWRLDGRFNWNRGNYGCVERGIDCRVGHGELRPPAPTDFRALSDLQQLAAALAEKPKKPVELIGEHGNGRMDFVAGSRCGERAFNQSSGVTGGQEVAGSNPVVPTDVRLIAA
jgi:hypothetical protein